MFWSSSCNGIVMYCLDKAVLNTTNQSQRFLYCHCQAHDWEILAHSKRSRRTRRDHTGARPLLSSCELTIPIRHIVQRVLPCFTNLFRAIRAIRAIQHAHRIHVCYIYGNIYHHFPSISPLYVSINIPAPWIRHGTWINSGPFELRTFHQGKSDLDGLTATEFSTCHGQSHPRLGVPWLRKALNGEDMDGTMGRWDDGMMGWWDDGMMGWWDDGMMGWWDDGDEWIWMDMNGYEWIWMDMNGYEWIWMDMNGYEWIWMDMNGYEWIWMDMGTLREQPSSFLFTKCREKSSLFPSYARP